MMVTFTVKADDIAYATMATSAGADFATIDLTTGAFTLLGHSGPNFLAGLGELGTPNPTTTLYAAQNNTLYTINTTNGSLTTVGSSGVTYADFGSTPTGLYAVSTNANLYLIDPLTGGATLIGSTGLSLSGDSILSTNSNTLYFEDSGNLYTLNVLTGAATLVGSLGGHGLGGIVLESGTLYGGELSPFPTIDTINPSTAAVTVGPSVNTGGTLIFGLAPFFAPVPEPSTVVSFLLGGGLLFARLLRRRCN